MPHMVSQIMIKMKKILLDQNEKALSSFKQRMPYAECLINLQLIVALSP